VAKKNKVKEQEIILSVFSNTVQDEAAYQLLQLFYKGAVENSIGMMRALNNDSGEEELILVGLERAEGGGVNTYPLARVLNPEDVSKYFSPDGHGGWFDPTAEAGAEVDPEPMDFSLPNDLALS
jgi:hypothetical protein